MGGRTLSDIEADLLSKQAEIDDLREDTGFRELVDGVSDDLEATTEFIDDTATGITEAAGDIGDNFDELQDAVDGVQELLGIDDLTPTMDAAGEVVEGIKGGTESVSNVLGKVTEGLGKLQKALEVVQKTDDLATAEGAESLEAFAEAFETVTDLLGPLVDKVPVLGPFLRLYAAAIRNIAISAGKIEEVVDRNQSLYQAIRPGHSLYLTPEYLASEKLRKLQAEYEALFGEAMEAAAAEREARGAPPAGAIFDPAQHVVNGARDACSGLIPDYNSDAFPSWLRTKLALESAVENHGSAAGGVVSDEILGTDGARNKELLASAKARLKAAQEAFDTEGAEHQAALDAYNDCVKRHIIRFGGYEGLDEDQFGWIGGEYPDWNVVGWEPSVSQVPKSARTSGRDMAFGVVGGAMLLAGVFLMANTGSNPVAGISGAFVQVSASDAAGSPFGPRVTVTVPPAVAAGDDVQVGTGSDGPPDVLVEPGIGSLCSETDHYPAIPATDGDGKETNSASKQVIGAYTTGLPPNTRITMEASGLDPTVGVVVEGGYVEFQFPLNRYGTHEIISVTADVNGTLVQLDPADFGASFRVGAGEGICGQSSISPPPTTTTTSTSTTTTTTTTTVPEIKTVPAGGGAVDFPSTVTGTGGPTVVATGTPETPGSDGDTTTGLVGLGLVVAGAALLGGTGAPGMREDQTPAGPKTYTADDRAFLQEIYKGADEAGVRIAGISLVDRIEDAFAGSKANPVKIGKATTLTVRVGEDGSLIPRRGDTDKAATSLIRIDVRPGIEFDSNGDAHTVWNAHVSEIDVETGRITDTGKAGPSSQEWKAQVGARPSHEAGNDPEFKDWVVESMPDSPGAAVAQALGNIGLGN